MTILDLARIITGSLRLDVPPPALSATIDWPQLLQHADGHSLTPLLYSTWRDAGLLSQIPLEARARLAQAYTDNAARNVNTRADLLDVQRLLAAAEVPHIVLKGWALVERLYTDPAQRVMYDHDLLLPPERAEVGWQALCAAGYRPLPARDEWVEKHLPPVWRNDGYHWDGYLFDPNYPRAVELHVRLWEQGWRGLQVRQLPDVAAGAQPGSVAGQTMQVLSDEDTLVHLAMHFAGHLVEREARLNQLLDLARFVKQAPAVNWAQILARAGSANVSRFVYASLWLAHEVFGARLPAPDVWQQLAAATPVAFRTWLAEHGAQDVLTSDYRHKRYGLDYRLTFLAAHSLRERLGIVRFAALPPLAQLMAKYQVRQPWLGALLYPRYLAERVGRYLAG